MKVEILTLCFAAKPTPNGELNILGATDVIVVPKTPIVVQWSTIVAKIRFEKIEEGEKEFKFSFVDSDGKSVTKPPPPQKVNIQIPAGATTASAVIVFGMQNLQLPSVGDYEIGLAVNERHEMSVPIYVRQPAQQPPAQPQSELH